MAKFYLDKSDKSNLITDPLQLSQSMYRSANEYYKASRFLMQDFNFMMVALTNVAFSCELYLKSMLIGFGTDYTYKKLIADRHNIEDLFKLLPSNEQDYIKNNICLKDRTEFDLLLHENGNAFIVYRYACERKDMCGHIDFLFALADILKFVYESLAKENNIILI